MKVRVNTNSASHRYTYTNPKYASCMFVCMFISVYIKPKSVITPLKQVSTSLCFGDDGDRLVRHSLDYLFIIISSHFLYLIILKNCIRVNPTMQLTFKCDFVCLCFVEFRISRKPGETFIFLHPGRN